MQLARVHKVSCYKVETEVTFEEKKIQRAASAVGIATGKSKTARALGRISAVSCCVVCCSVLRRLLRSVLQCVAAVVV